MRYVPVEERFWPKVQKSSPDECWIWTAYKTRQGYGVIGAGYKKTVLAHRVSYALANGHLADDDCVLHRCDNPSCVNPSHLFLGTIADNNADRHKKGRSRCGAMKGTTNPRAIINDEIAAKIFVSDRPPAEIMQQFGVCLGTIYDIKRRIVWRDATEGLSRGYRRSRVQP